MSTDFPTEGMALTHLLVVGNLERSHAFYRDVLGAEVYREYGGTSVVLRFLGPGCCWSPAANRPRTSRTSPSLRRWTRVPSAIR
jgi:catechol 2,3-dioxygenase-like lactoylglutathione lyase family enzyme